MSVALREFCPVCTYSFFQDINETLTSCVVCGCVQTKELVAKEFVGPEIPSEIREFIGTGSSQRIYLENSLQFSETPHEIVKQNLGADEISIVVPDISRLVNENSPAFLDPPYNFNYALDITAIKYIFSVYGYKANDVLQANSYVCCKFIPKPGMKPFPIQRRFEMYHALKALNVS